MNLLSWDLIESFGVHGPSSNPSNYAHLYDSTSSSYPLVPTLLSVPEWRELYFAHQGTAMKPSSRRPGAT
tara:strand:- start:3978 stop:4187 length:210 start_codon:yes stop_codon:yes gene_type:complete